MRNVRRCLTKGKPVGCAVLSHIDPQCLTAYPYAMATKNASLTIRIPAELKAALEAEAARQDRTMSKLAELLLRDGLKSKRGR